MKTEELYQLDWLYIEKKWQINAIRILIVNIKWAKELF